MDRIVQKLWVGTMEDARDPDRVRNLGISAVVNATSEAAPALLTFRYLQLDQEDCHPIPAGVLARFLDWMCRSIEGRHAVLVYSGAGVSRAPAFAIAYLMQVGFSWNEGMELLRSKRPQVNPHPALRDSVLEYFRR